MQGACGVAGCVSELVAKWLGSCGLEPTLLLEPSRELTLSPEPDHKSVLGVAEGQAESADAGTEARPTSHREDRTLCQLTTLRSTNK